MGAKLGASGQQLGRAYACWLKRLQYRGFARVLVILASGPSVARFIREKAPQVFSRTQFQGDFGTQPDGATTCARLDFEDISGKGSLDPIGYGFWQESNAVITEWGGHR